ncbi:unnamed protein product, partial [Prorocentrum cordatum]
KLPRRPGDFEPPEKARPFWFPPWDAPPRGDTGWRQAQQLGGVVHHAEGEAAGHAVEKASERVAFAAGFLCCASEVAAERIWAARLPLARAVAGQGATVSAAVPRI